MRIMFMQISKRTVDDVIAFKSIDWIKLKFQGNSFPRSILVRHIRHARFPRDMLATSSRVRHKDATKMLRENCSRGILT